MSMAEASDCSDRLTYGASVTVSLEVGDELSLELPARLRWSEEGSGVSIATGPMTLDELAADLPYEPPVGWVVVGAEVSGGCSQPFVIRAWIARDACEDPTDCFHETFVDIATVEFSDEATSLCGFEY